jgi:hypothetical protein
MPGALVDSSSGVVHVGPSGILKSQCPSTFTTDSHFESTFEHASLAT